ncbi:MAG: enamine deaminase RidA, partial [Frankiales bacterium]|nr:enamine deaminase RidA [Frankiales bacterium]
CSPSAGSTPPTAQRGEPVAHRPVAGGHAEGVAVAREAAGVDGTAGRLDEPPERRVRGGRVLQVDDPVERDGKKYAALGEGVGRAAQRLGGDPTKPITLIPVVAPGEPDLLVEVDATAVPA